MTIAPHGTHHLALIVLVASLVGCNGDDYITVGRALDAPTEHDGEVVDLDASSALVGEGTLGELIEEPLSVGPHRCDCGSAVLEACLDSDAPLTCVTQ